MKFAWNERSSESKMKLRLRADVEGFIGLFRKDRVLVASLEH